MWYGDANEYGRLGQVVGVIKRCEDPFGQNRRLSPAGRPPCLSLFLTSVARLLELFMVHVESLSFTIPVCGAWLVLS